MLGLGTALEKLSQNILWSFPWSETLRKRAIRYLLRRYIGQFLLEPLTLDQLTVDLANGTGIIKDLALDIHSLNEVAEQLNLPFKFIDGYIGEILVNVPWRKLFNENCFVGISGLKLVLHPKQRDGEVSLVDSMIDSMSTSMQIAQECLSQVTQAETERESNLDTKIEPLSENISSEETTSPIDAIEHFAKAIDTILNKIKVRFSDSVIRLEYMPKLSVTGVALDIKIDNIDYFDEAGFEKDPSAANNSDKAQFLPDSFTSKKFLIEGISLYTNEFSVKPHFPDDESLNESHLNKSADVDVLEEEFHDTYNTSFINNAENSSDKDQKSCNDNFLIKESILIAKLGNRQEIKLKLRKNDAVSGPKVSVEANCGSLVTFLSPRQLHLLMDLAIGISSPDSIESAEPLDNKVGKANLQKPMNQNDFKKIERELMNHIAPQSQVPSFGLNQQEGWSSPPDITSDEEFLPLNSSTGKPGFPNKHMSSSSLTDVSDMEASFTSTSSHPHSSSKKHLENETLTNFKIRLNSLCVIILHDDVLITSCDPHERVTSSSIKEMQKKSESFFSSLGNNFSSDHCYEEFIELKDRLKDVCMLSHLRLIGTSLLIDGKETSSLNKWEMKTGIICGWCEITECLNDSPTDAPNMVYSNLVTFKDKPKLGNNQFYTLTKPKVQVNITQTQNMRMTGRSRRVSIPKSEVKINFEECVMEVDISIVDRINTLLNKQNIIIESDEIIPLEKLPPSHLDNQAFFKEIMDDIVSKPETITNLIVLCPDISVKLYFPIPDLRPVSDMRRIPWWKKNVRDELLVIQSEDFYFQAKLDSCTNSFEVLCTDIHFLFQEKDGLPPWSVLRASGSRGIERGFNPVRIYIQSFPSKSDLGLEDEPAPDHKNLMTKSMMGFLEEVDNAPNIFNKRKVASQQQETINELTIPADSDELNRFINDTLKNIQIEVDITLSDVQMILPSKHIYELVYNRLVSDLLLWVPSAPKHCARVCTSLPSMMNELNIGNPMMNDYRYANSEFKAFTSFKNLGAEKDDAEFNYTSLYDQSYPSSHQCEIAKTPNGQTFLGLQVKIFNGSGAIHTPFRDGEYKVIPGRHGNVSFTFENGLMFIASGYKGDMDSCQGCITVDKINVFHKADNLSPLSPIQLDPEFPLSHKFDPVLYPSETLYKMGGSTSPVHESKESLSICFKMDFDMVKNEKVLELAGGMFGLTLSYYMKGASENWMSQLGDMFNVEDYPVEGYSLPDVITELNFHFKHCGIDYRPLHLPLKTYVAIDSLAISSNLTIKGKSSVLLVIVEDAGLFLSQNLVSKKVNLKEHYVCVTDLGVFELCIKLENDSSNIPLQEILFSNNIIHLRTCSDSCKALLELLIYLANEGDLIHEPDNSKLSRDKRVVSEPISLGGRTSFPDKQTSIDCHDLVENMMQEAMLESTLHDKSTSNSEYYENDVDIFFFPDENKSTAVKDKADSNLQTHRKSHELDTESALREALEEDSPASLHDETNTGTDDEFCVLEDIPGTGIKSPSGKPKAKHIKFDHIAIIDEHFDPANNYSYEARLSTPKHFPKPYTKYNLQEISLVWHMYGGRDFDDEHSSINDKNGNCKASKSPKVRSPRNSPQTNCKLMKGQTVTFVNGDANILPDCPSPLPPSASPSFLRPNANLKWFTRGGPGRCHDTLMEIQLNKLRFKYEIYPEESTLESRHILEINDVEIRDRLASSKINKFLYQFSSECFPRQASSNMIQIKAITKRSEPTVNSSETSLNISVRPIRLNIDQDALIFLSEFVETVSNCDKESEYGEEERPHCSLPHAPVMAVNYDNLSDLNGEITQANFVQNTVQKNTKENPQDSLPSPVYFRNVIFSPDVPIKIDYHGKHIDINSQYGALAGLIIGLGQLDHSEITLKRIDFKSGVLGVNKLVYSLIHEWVYDIRKNQLPSILGGIGPMHSFVKLFNGIKDLFWLPIEQYHKDGRVFRGIQRGTSAFTSSSAHAVLDLTGRFVGCIQSTAETMYDIVSSGPSVRHRRYKTERGQAMDIREGVTAAYGLVRNGLGDAASNLMKVAAEEHSHKGVSGAVGGVLRQIPPSVVQPIIIASEATCTVIGGITNQLVPDARKEAAEKWKS